MAAIGKIRNQGKLLAILLGGTLILFIATSAIDGVNFDRDLTAGIVAGEELNYMDYLNEVEKVARKLEERKKSQGQQFTEADRAQVEDEVWKRLTTNKYIKDQRIAAGITVTGNEIFDNMALKPDLQIKNYFADESGQFSKARMSEAYAGINELPIAQQDLLKDIEEYLEENIAREKYDQLIQKAAYAPRWQAEQFYENRNRKLTAKYVFFDFSEIKDEDISVTDAEINNYIREHRAKYSHEEALRKVEYVSFPIHPSKKDTHTVLSRLNNLNEEFLAAKDDSLFVAINSDFSAYDAAYVTEENVKAPEEHKSALYNTTIGSIYGPYLNGNNYVLAKVVDRKNIPDSVLCRHILIKSQDVFTRAKDSIMTALKEGADFSTLARKYSEDPGSAVKGGDLGWAKPGQMVKPFNDKIFFEGDKGTILTCFSQFGFHIIDVTKYVPTKPAAKIAYVHAELYASDETSDSVYNKASEFHILANKSDFKTLASEKKLDVRVPAEINSSAKGVGGLDKSESIVYWAFKHDKGDISSIDRIENAYVVAYIADVKEEGLMDIEDARTEVEFKIKQQKKGEKLIEQYKEAMNAATIEEVAAKSGKKVETLSEINFENPFSREMGRDMKVFGTCYGLEEGALSKPVIGNKGVYIVKNEFFIPAKQVEDDYKEAKEKVVQSMQGRTKYGSYQALEEQADVKDLRYKFKAN